MQEVSKPERIYALGHSERELTRLNAQAKMLEPFTRQMFEEAGLARGMRILDVGSGAGDVAFLAASFAGPTGEVIGIDREPKAVELATSRAADLGIKNVRFMAGDLDTISLENTFDAVIGRLVLMFCPDPAATLRKLAERVRPGGVVAFQDYDMKAACSYPPSPLFEQCLRWIITAFERAGNEIRMGLKLYSTFVSAGLPPPSLRTDAAIGGGKDLLIYFVASEVVRSLLPLIEKFGIATAAQVDIETLRDRLEADTVSRGGIVVSPALIGAWSRVP